MIVIPLKNNLVRAISDHATIIPKYLKFFNELQTLWNRQSFTQRTENNALLRKYSFHSFFEQLIELVNCDKEIYKLNLKRDSNNAIVKSLTESVSQQICFR